MEHCRSPDGVTSVSVRPCACCRIVWSELKTDSVLFVFITLSDSLLPSNAVKYFTILLTTRPQCMQHGPGLPWALGSAQITHTGVELPQVLNCQDGCQTNSRRYDDLLSTDSVEHVASFLPTVLSVVPLARCVVCLSVCL